jgi:hypothetical protein
MTVAPLGVGGSEMEAAVIDDSVAPGSNPGMWNTSCQFSKLAPATRTAGASKLRVRAAAAAA